MQCEQLTAPVGCRAKTLSVEQSVVAVAASKLPQETPVRIRWFTLALEQISTPERALKIPHVRYVPDPYIIWRADAVFVS